METLKVVRQLVQAITLALIDTLAIKLSLSRKISSTMNLYRPGTSMTLLRLIDRGLLVGWDMQDEDVINQEVRTASQEMLASCNARNAGTQRSCMHGRVTVWCGWRGGWCGVVWHGVAWCGMA